MPSPTWRVRPARPQDRTFVLGLVPRLAQGFPLPACRTQEDVVQAETALLEAALEAMPAGAELLIAETSAGEPGGFVYLEQQLDYYGRPHGHVSVLAVAASTEGQGVGRTLLEAAETWTRQQGLSLLTLNVFAGNARARAVYDRLGYVPETLRYVKTLEDSMSESTRRP